MDSPRVDRTPPRIDNTPRVDRTPRIDNTPRSSPNTVPNFGSPNLGGRNDGPTARDLRNNDRGAPIRIPESSTRLPKPDPTPRDRTPAGNPNLGQPNSGQPNLGQPNFGQPNVGGNSLLNRNDGPSARDQREMRRDQRPQGNDNRQPGIPGQPNVGQPNPGQPNLGGVRGSPNLPNIPGLNLPGDGRPNMRQENDRRDNNGRDGNGRDMAKPDRNSPIIPGAPNLQNLTPNGRPTPRVGDAPGSFLPKPDGLPGQLGDRDGRPNGRDPKRPDGRPDGKPEIGGVGRDNGPGRDRNGLPGIDGLDGRRNKGNDVAPGVPGLDPSLRKDFRDLGNNFERMRNDRNGPDRNGLDLNGPGRDGPGRDDGPGRGRDNGRELPVVRLPNLSEPTKADRHEKITPIRIGKNGELPKLRGNLDLNELREARSLVDADHRLRHVREQLHDQRVAYRDLDLNRFSGSFQDRIAHRHQHDEFRFVHLERSTVGQRVSLSRQYELCHRGDVARQLNLSQALLASGGWSARRVSPIVPTYTHTHFSVWYGGPRLYPRHCWAPRWTPWVDWCFWDRCDSLYDPRPRFCRPVHCRPPRRWIVWTYPTWRPLPLLTCGTWVDAAPVTVIQQPFLAANPQPVVIDPVQNGAILPPPGAEVVAAAPPAGPVDVQLLAVRFVDNGHPESNTGPRYRVWLKNVGQQPIQAPFEVTLLAANDDVPAAELPQSGGIVESLGIDEVATVDVRLPIETLQFGVSADGQRAPFSRLHVLVDSHQELQETDETNNGAVVDRDEVLPVDPALFALESTTLTPGALTSVAGEGFGPEPGQLLLSINGIEFQPEIHGWYDLGVHFKLPEMAIAAAVDAELVVIRGDGAASNPATFRLTPATQIIPINEAPAFVIPQ